MRTLRLVLPLLLALTLAASATAEEQGYGIADWMKRSSPWEGHGIGSYYVEVMKTKMPKMPNMPNMPNVPGMPKDGVMETRMKTTLVKIEPTAFVLKTETTSMGRTTTHERREPRVRRTKADMTKVKPLGEESIVIEGKSYACKKWLVEDFSTLMDDPTPKQPGGEKTMRSTMGAATVWEHPDRKIGVVQIKSTISVMGRTHAWQWQTTKLSVSRTIGQHTFKAREITMQNSMARGKTVMEIANKFPGGSLRMNMTSNVMGMSTSSSTEVTEYVKKPAAVVTGK